MGSRTLISRNCVPLSDVTCSVNIPFASFRLIFRYLSHVPARDSRATRKVPKTLFSFHHGRVSFRFPRRREKLIDRKLDVRLIIKWRNARSPVPASREICTYSNDDREFRLGRFFFLLIFLVARGEFSSRA